MFLGIILDKMSADYSVHSPGLSVIPEIEFENMEKIWPPFLLHSVFVVCQYLRLVVSNL